MKYLLGTDIGTSGTKTILMNTEGKLISQDLEEYDVLTPKPLWQSSGRMCGLKRPAVLSGKPC